ncbi:hypothetical protein GOP47_0008164 [Adiantum capillus-veneris]|uniref:thermospermine synthase n=1 Tax=Adiantum capillus-veneris TaxID=13818 RepID=A0A9D4UY11_ADICA|nr:hypothetical protein GOP47_0008164 [Adiantum capillus-veneris]
MSPSMAAETACYPSNALPSARDPFSNASFVNGNLIASYAAATTNGGGVNAGSSKHLSTSNGLLSTTYSNGSSVPAATPPSTPSLQGVVTPPPHIFSNGSSFPNPIATKGPTSSAINGSSNTSNIKISSMSNSHGQASQSNGTLSSMTQPEVTAPQRPSLWFEEDLGESLRWSFGLKRILHTGVSKYQDIALLDTEPFGKVLTLDGRMQSAQIDEWVYHECLVHPALLLHQGPRSIFIAGGGEGSTARECLLHKSVRKVVMCDIDEEVVKFCSAHLEVNKVAFESSKLELVINDAKAELKRREERFDVIIGDLADPLEWGPCYTLYSQGFYQNVVKPRLNPNGIFVTQAGPAGVLSHREVFTSIYNTLKSVFTYVVAYSAHVPSYCDVWGWVVASDQPLMSQMSSDELDRRIVQRIKGGQLRYLDGPTLYASTILNRTVRESLENEKHVYTEESARFVYGHGRIPNSATH